MIPSKESFEYSMLREGLSSVFNYVDIINSITEVKPENIEKYYVSVDWGDIRGDRTALAICGYDEQEERLVVLHSKTYGRPLFEKYGTDAIRNQIKKIAGEIRGVIPRRNLQHAIFTGTNEQLDKLLAKTLSLSEIT